MTAHPGYLYLILITLGCFFAYAESHCPACLRFTIEDVGRNDRECEHCGKPIADRVHWGMVIPWVCWMLAPLLGVLAFSAVKLRARFTEEEKSA